MRPVCGLILAALAVCGCRDERQAIPFDEVRWKQADVRAEPPTVRQLMVADLVQRDALRGLSRDDVIDLLGTPDSVDAGAAGFPRWDIIYVLGDEDAGPYSLDTEALGVKFGADGRVLRWGTSVN